jgi:spore germination protein
MKIIIVLAMAVLLYGCVGIAPKTNMIENITPTILLYLKEGENSTVESTMVIPAVKEEKKQVLTVRSKMMKESRYLLTRNYYREIKSGQLHLLFISEDMAKKGIIDHINTLLLDQEIKTRLYMAVIRGDFTSYLQSQFDQQEGIDRFLYKMFRHYEKKGDLTIVDLHQFLVDYYSPYSDPVLPVFDIQQGQLIYAGTALFREDRLVKSIPVHEDFLFRFIHHSRCFHTNIPLPDRNIVLGSVFATREIRFDDRHEHGIVKVRLRGIVEEYTGDKDLSRPEEADDMIRDLERYLEERIHEHIRDWQHLSIDPAHIGRKTLSPFRQPFSGSEWKRRWRDLPVTVRVELELENLGWIKPKKQGPGQRVG